MNSPNANNTDAQPIRYLTASELYNINVEILDGDTLVRDLHLLNSAARRPMISLFGQPQFPTLIDKAAALLHSLAYHHLFMDGNKRTALQAVTIFLNLNGYDLTWDRQTEYDFILDVAQGKYDVPAIAEFITPYMHPLPASDSDSA
jgi:death on curing protein